MQITRGQMIECIDDKRVKGRLTKGQFYYVTLFSPDHVEQGNPPEPYVVVECDDNVERWYPLKRFKL